MPASGECQESPCSGSGTLSERCSDSLRVGFEGRQLDRWLGDLGRDFARWQADADWRAVSVREVY